MYATAVLACLLPFCLCVHEKAEHGAAHHYSLYHTKDGHNPVFDQEALLGAGSTDELEDLPDDVRERRLRNLAMSHDKNKDGVIEASELKEWILHSFSIVDREEAAERMAEDDGNKDGKVTLAEIYDKQYGHTLEEVEEMQKEGTKPSDEAEMDVLDVILEDKKKFAAADLDKDGSLDSKEFQAFFLPHNFPHMYDIEMERAMKDMDKNKDGSVALDEFIMNDQSDEEQLLAEKEQFAELDKNKDGKLNVAELKPWALADNDQIADEEVEHLIDECDENKDKKLSIDEVVKKADDFVTSSATDYGRVLHFVKDEL